MNIIINHTSMEPIYEQIVRQIRGQIIEGSLKENELLPSVRALSRELKISALTVKKAYDLLDEEGLIVTVHGKGSFVAETNRNLIMEERQKEVEADLEKAIRRGISAGLPCKEIREMFTCIISDIE